MKKEEQIEILKKYYNLDDDSAENMLKYILQMDPELVNKFFGCGEDGDVSDLDYKGINGNDIKNVLNTSSFEAVLFMSAAMKSEEVFAMLEKMKQKQSMKGKVVADD